MHFPYDYLTLSSNKQKVSMALTEMMAARSHLVDKETEQVLALILANDNSEAKDAQAFHKDAREQGPLSSGAQKYFVKSGTRILCGDVKRKPLLFTVPSIH